jgi:hemolysin secretion/activation protein ShlB/FhaC/HecB
MFALLTALVLAQSSVSVNIGGKTKPPDSVTAAKRDSIARRREDYMDSLRTVHAKHDSTAANRRRAQRIPVTPGLLASAFKDPRAASLIARARVARLTQDSALTGYDAISYERMSVGMGFKRIGRDRLFMRSERAAHVLWTRGSPAYVEIVGKRAVVPMIEDADADVNLGEEVALPYFPGREGLWLGSGLAKKDVSEDEVIHPLANGAEAYYTYATGDSVSFQLPGGKTIQLRELLVRPRAPKWNVALGSLWFDTGSARLVRAVYRLAEPMDIWAIADEDAEDPDDKPPGWVKGMLSPLKAEITAITVEYGLHEGQFWMPRVESLEGDAQAGFMHVPFKMEQSFKYASVNGKMPAIPQIAVADTAMDSVSRAARRARRNNECKDGGDRVRTIRHTDNGQPMIVKTPCDTAALARSPELPKSIYDEGEELFGKSERDALVSEALTLGAQPGWIPQPIVFTYGLALTRYNKIEGLSTGISASQVLGQGYTAHASARIGIADWQPNGELGLARSDGRHTLGVNAYRRLASANEFSDPFSFGSSLSALLFGRDEGFYYRTIGAELTGTGDDSATGSWRLFAEHQSDAVKKTNFSLAGKIGSSDFADNIDAVNGNYFGVSAERHGSRGLDPHGLRLFGQTSAEAVTGTRDFLRGMFDATVSHGLTSKFDGALTLAAGTSAGQVPIQRAWFLGGSQTIRGEPAGAAVGDAFWMSRVELGSSFVGARPVVFYDVGWAGDRHDFSNPGRPISGAGVGASFMDGLVRFDVARGIYPEKKIRANLYVEARF